MTGFCIDCERSLGKQRWLSRATSSQTARQPVSLRSLRSRCFSRNSIWHQSSISWMADRFRRYRILTALLIRPQLKNYVSSTDPGSLAVSRTDEKNGECIVCLNSVAFFHFQTGSFITLGIIVFSGTCYLYVFTRNPQWIQATPYGGMLLVVGWTTFLL